MSEHANLRLKTYEHGSSCDVGIESVDEAIWVANDIERGVAARIVACVNACAGIPTDQLSQLAPPDTLAAAEIEAAWRLIESEYDIEPRAQIEAEAKTNGFKYGLAQAIHTIWKRDPKVADLAAAAEEAVECDTCGVGSHLPSGRCDHCDSLRVQWKSLHDEREEQYAALRRRGIRFVRFGGTLEAIVPDDHADMLKSAMPEDEVKRIDGMIEGCVLSADEREDVGDSDLLDICLRAMDLRDQVQFLSKEVRQRVRVIDELTRVINKE